MSKDIVNNFEGLQVLKNNIVIQFLEKVSANNEFEQTVSSGKIQIVEGKEKQIDKPRWATIVSFGADVENVTAGHFALVQPLKWTTSIMFNNERIWMTNDDSIIALSSEYPSLEIY